MDDWDRVAAIAHKEIEGQYDYSVGTAFVQANNTPWNRFLPLDRSCKHRLGLWKKLVNKEYWTVSFGELDIDEETQGTFGLTMPLVFVECGSNAVLLVGEF
jgi:hypothetical protein